MMRKPSGANGLRGRANIGLRQIKSEGASLAGSASQLDFSTKETGQLATDRKTKASAAIFSAGAGICLLESLEDDSLLVCRDADAAIRNLKGHNGRCAA